jgi:cytoskeletal protein CcmA (bactofilin family)
MFGPRTKGAENETRDTHTPESTPRAPAAEPHQAVPRMASPTIARRVVDMPGSSRRSASSSDAERKLTVGKGLSLAGEITSCDILVVEGKVEAKLSDGKLLEITEAGQFRGSVEIENADIAGRYDGQLIVHGRLTVRSTGRISGMVKYGELEVNAGGQIIGEVQVTGGGAQQAQPSGNGFKSAAKFTASSEDDDQSNKTERKTA